MGQYTDGCFLCVPCRGGYFSFYNEFCNPDAAEHIYILKGAHGFCSGAVLHAVSRSLRERGVRLETVYNQARPGEAESLFLPDFRIAVTDGNFPRNTEPKYPVAVETVINVDEAMDQDMLRRNKNALILIGKILETERRRTLHYLSAVKSVNADSNAIVSPCVDREKIRRYAVRFAAREFPEVESRKNTRHVFLSAITPDGVTVHYDTLKKYGRVIAIEDGNGVAASLLVEYLRDEAEKRGLEAIVCRCQTDPETRAEHLLLPEADVAFFTGNRYHPAPPNTERSIHVARFLDTEKLAQSRFRLNFNKKAVRSLIDETVKAEARLRELRDMTDAYYEAALIPEKLESLTTRLTQDIFALIG